MVSVLQPGRALVDPIEGVAAAVVGRRWVFPLLFLMVAGSFSGAAFALRWDAAPTVIGAMAQSGELAKASQREVEEKVETAQRVKLVGGMVGGLTAPPFVVLLLAVVLKMAAWLLGRFSPFASAFSAAAVAMLPIALFHLLLGAALLQQTAVSEAQLTTLLPSHLGVFLPDVGPVVKRLLTAVDLFALWSVALLGLGFSAASGMGKGRALMVAALLYAMYVGVFVIGIPGMAMGGA